jgi:bifunctional enzyme Fae/Hps
MLSKKKRYLQIALNSTPSQGESIIYTLPSSDRILIEAGTPLIKEFGVEGIRRLKDAWEERFYGFSHSYEESQTLQSNKMINSFLGVKILSESETRTPTGPNSNIYVVADTKCMDRGKTEVDIAIRGGASAATVLGAAPIATINYFIQNCAAHGLDSMIDFIGVPEPIKVLRKLRQMPTVVVLHRGVDEETFDRNSPIPYIQINKIRSSYDVRISIAGGDTIREVQRAAFNGADIVVVWRDFYNPNSNTGLLAQQFLAEVK